MSEATITAADLLWIVKGICYLAGRCDYAATEDGLGFNGRDAHFGHALAEKPAESWTPRMYHAAWRVLRTYKSSQLPNAGIDFDALPAPPEPTDPAWTSIVKRRAIAAKPRTAKLAGQVITFAWDVKDRAFRDILDAVKALPGRRFDGLTKTWSVALTASTAGDLLSFITQFEVDISDADVNAIEDVLGLARENIEASRRSETTWQPQAKLGGTLRPFQAAGVEYIVRNKRVLVADEMGLGKTIQAIAALEELAVRGEQVFPAVIVTPASVKLNWAREIQKWAPGRSVEVLNGKPGKPGTYQADYIVVNYDNLKKHVLAFEDWGIRSVVADEAHYVKNHKAQRTQALKTLADGLAVRILLTGTPILNRPVEALSPLAILDRVQDAGGWAKLYYHHCNAYSNGYGMEFGEPQDLEALNARLRATCYIRREKAQVLKELPPKQHSTVYLPFDAKLYGDAEANFYAFCKNPERASHAEHLVRINTLRQVAVRAKLDAAKNWVEDFLESGEKLVVFAYHREAQDMLAREFPGCAVIRGDDDAAARQANVDRFQTDPNCRLIVCSIRAGAEGITLTAASNVAFVELDWNPGRLQQAEDRIHRIGQRATSVNVWRLLAENTIDTDLADLVAQKAKVVKAFAEGGELEEVAMLSAIEERISARAATKKAKK